MVGVGGAGVVVVGSEDAFQVREEALVFFGGLSRVPRFADPMGMVVA